MLKDWYVLISMFGHCILAFFILFFALPAVIVHDKRKFSLDKFFSNYIYMVFLLIVTIYILAATKLYEVPALFLVLLIIGYISYRVNNKAHIVEHKLFSFRSWFYDFIDGFEKIVGIKPFLVSVQQSFKELKAYNILKFFVLCSVFAHAAYLRFYDAFVNAAPALSDAYVTLAWTKYINRRILFHDGLYPQGMHIYLSVISKIAFIDPYYILKFMGPINGLLIVISIYLFAQRMSKSWLVGAVAAFMYGSLGYYIDPDFIRQASTNSQEFAFVFITPCWYFFHKYIKDGDKRDLVTAFLAACVLGFIHTLAFAYMALGVFLLLVSAITIKPKEYFKKVLLISGLGVLSGVISMLPIGIGYLVGYKFHSSSANYLLATSSYIMQPKLQIFDYAALGCIALMFLYSFISKRFKENKLAVRFVFLLGVFGFGFYYYAGFLTQSVLIGSRAIYFWDFVVAISFGFGIYVIYDMFLFIFKNGYFEAFFCIALVLSANYYYKPSPYVPYKMESNANIKGYLSISTEFLPTEWMIVSQEEGYALCFGIGNHLLVRNFLAGYNPTDKQLVYRDAGGEQKLVTPDTFIFYEKKVFKPIIYGGASYGELTAIIDRREKEMPKLLDWINKYKETHNNLSIYYEDENLRIYRIHIEPTKKDQFETLWGN